MGESSRAAWGRGLATIAADGSVLDAWYPELGLGAMPGAADDGASRAGAQGRDELRNVEVGAVETSIDLDAAPSSATDLYLRLHLLSTRMCRPRTINLDGTFGLLTNVAW